MTKTFHKIEHAAMSLPRDDRALLAEKLIESLEDHEELRLDPEWVAEIERRVDASRSGKVKTIPADQVFRKLRKKLLK
jgi:putative addiction module component (TIGR02574 family)